MVYLDPIVDNQKHDLKETYKKLIKKSEEVRIATGYFYLSGFNLYKDDLDNLQDPEELDNAPFRILMGRQTDWRTTEEIDEGMSLREKIKESMHEDISDLNNAQIERLDRLKKFIAKGLVDFRISAPDEGNFHAKGASFRMISSENNSSSDEDRRPVATIVGSSNFSKTGHTENIELNLTSQNPREAEAFEDWFDNQWANSEEFSKEIIDVIESNESYQEWKKEKTEEKEEIDLGTFIEPFEFYKLLAYDALDGNISRRYDSPLYHFQHRGYESAKAKLAKYDGCIISDSVGLGKSFIGGELLRDYRMVGNKCLLIVPAHLKSQWKDLLQDATDEDGDPYFNLDVDGEHLKVMSITKFQNKSYEEAEGLHDKFDVVLIDEAHRFRNSGKWKPRREDYKGTRRYANLRLFKDKTMIMLTATPLNNSAEDLKNLISLFTDENELRNKAGLDFDAFNEYINHATERKKIASEKKEATREEKQKIVNQLAEKAREIGKILNEVMILRTRKHVKDQIREEDDIEFKFKSPRVYKENYDLPAAYQPAYEVLPDIMNALHLPHITIRNPQGGGTLKVLYKLNLLKRLESSPYAFIKSLETLYNSQKLLLSTLNQLPEDQNIRDLQEIEEEENKTLEDFTQNELVAEDLHEALEDLGLDETIVRKGEDMTDDLAKSSVQDIKKFIYEDLSLLAHFSSMFITGIAPKNEEINSEKHRIDNWLREKDLDKIPDIEPQEFDRPIYPTKNLSGALDSLKGFYNCMFQLERFKDTKIKRLIDVLSEKNGKVVIFTQYRATADYVYERLLEHPQSPLNNSNSAVVKGGDRNKQKIVKRLSPEAAGYQSTLKETEETELDYVVATDTLSEGVNLQDVNTVVNYDLPWNPMKIVQRVGRIDRIGSTEDKFVHNFFPDGDLEAAIKLLKRLQTKIDDIALIVGKENNILDPNEDQIIEKAGVEKEKTIGELELEEIEDSVRKSRTTEDINELDDISKNPLLKKAGGSKEEREAFERILLKKELKEEFGLTSEDFNFSEEFFETQPEERETLYTCLDGESAPSKGVLGLMHVWFENNEATLNRTERKLYHSRNEGREIKNLKRVRQLDIKPEYESAPIEDIENWIRKNVEKIREKVDDKTSRIEKNQAIGAYKQGGKKSKHQEMVISYLENKVIPEGIEYEEEAKSILQKIKDPNLRKTEEGKVLREIIGNKALIEWDLKKLLDELKTFIKEYIEESSEYQSRLAKKSEVKADIQAWAVIGD